MNASSISTHLLDTTRGQPAAGVSVRLEFRAPDGWREISSGVTDGAGRISRLGPAELESGNYRIEVDIGAFYRKAQVKPFFSAVCLSFVVIDPPQHYHVPLLISPFAISTYQGS